MLNYMITGYDVVLYLLVWILATPYSYQRRRGLNSTLFIVQMCVGVPLLMAVYVCVCVSTYACHGQH